MRHEDIDLSLSLLTAGCVTLTQLCRAIFQLNSDGVVLFITSSEVGFIVIPSIHWRETGNNAPPPGSDKGSVCTALNVQNTGQCENVGWIQGFIVITGMTDLYGLQRVFNLL